MGCTILFGRETVLPASTPKKTTIFEHLFMIEMGLFVVYMSICLNLNLATHPFLLSQVRLVLLKQLHNSFRPNVPNSHVVATC